MENSEDDIEKSPKENYDPEKALEIARIIEETRVKFKFFRNIHVMSTNNDRVLRKYPSQIVDAMKNPRKASMKQLPSQQMPVES